MAIEETHATVCRHCKKKFNDDFELKGLSIICPHCKRPQ